MEEYIVHTWLGDVRVVFVRDPFRIAQIRLPGGPDARGQERTPAGGSDFDCVPDVPELMAVARMIREFFESGRPMETPWQWLCLDHLRPLQQAVLRITAAIPCGRVRTYKEIAAEMGKPSAARFVGNVLAANPWPLLIACHRVIRSNGSLGGFGGGTEMKAALIAHETGGKHPLLAHRCGM